ncbi:hypothetical protein FHG64_12805 [Antarcticibacterium flavum]|uniref:Uncharacterized protein n=1 Tax=Antarcticibacterium flavum TaxID=2058175 RepID=A0A5B7X3T9_9FLAO|nr:MULTISPECIES: hypothetical protein [Antarcticibacterium]MCM4158458.1 hypothetical protein [Antarcticibacterium sp. W02-3]QCY70214.1 hypothetical protein FHG64_12805 [Antarcticibacterium flavum]
MNYIKQLNSAFEKFYFDDRLNPTHISLYMALFQEWNSSRFAAEFFVNRRELMQVAKIGSKSTYHRCIVEMHQWGYLSYLPSNNPYKGSKIRMTTIRVKKEVFEEDCDLLLEKLADQHRPTSDPAVSRSSPISEQVMDRHRPIGGQALVPYINNSKQINKNKQPKDLQAVLLFFTEKSFSAEEGNKFFEYYQRKNWKTSDEQEIKNWQAVAITWMDRVELFGSQNSQIKKRTSQNRDNLKTTKMKDYGQPL